MATKSKKNRSAVTGLYVGKEAAAKSPSTTVAVGKSADTVRLDYLLKLCCTTRKNIDAQMKKARETK